MPAMYRRNSQLLSQVSSSAATSATTPPPPPPQYHNYLPMLSTHSPQYYPHHHIYPPGTVGSLSNAARWRLRARRVPVLVGLVVATAAAAFVIVVCVLVIAPSVGHLVYASALVVQEPLRWFLLYDKRVELSLERDGFDVTFAAYPRDQQSSRHPSSPLQKQGSRPLGSRPMRDSAAAASSEHSDTPLLDRLTTNGEKSNTERIARPRIPAHISDELASDSSLLQWDDDVDDSRKPVGIQFEKRSSSSLYGGIPATNEHDSERRLPNGKLRTILPKPDPEQIVYGDDVVPAIIHHIVLGMEAKPSWLKARDTCLDMHPGYDYMFWDDKRAETFIKAEYPELWDMWKGYKYPIQRADSLRYMVMYKYGGIFLDMDLECRRSLGPLRRFEFIAPAATPSGVSNGFFMTKAQNPFVKRLVEHLPIMNRNWFFLPYAAVMFSTGCFYMSAIWAHYWDADKLRVLTGPDSLHRLSGVVRTPLFHHLGSSSWHSYDAHFLGRVSHWFKDLPLHPFRLGMLLAFALVFAACIFFATCLYRVCREQSRKDALLGAGLAGAPVGGSGAKYEAAPFPRHSYDSTYTPGASMSQQRAAAIAHAQQCQADEDALSFFRKTTFFNMDPSTLLGARRPSPAPHRDAEEGVGLLERSCTPSSEISSVYESRH